MCAQCNRSAVKYPENSQYKAYHRLIFLMKMENIEKNFQLPKHRRLSLTNRIQTSEGYKTQVRSNNFKRAKKIIKPIFAESARN